MGALNVWLDEYEALIVLHLALGTLLWTGVVGLALQLYPVREPSPERARGGAEAVAGLMASARAARRRRAPARCARSSPTTWR